MTSPVGIPVVEVESKPVLDKRWLNIIFYIVGAICIALALVDLPAFKPWLKALTSFGTAMFAVARWDRALVGSSKDDLLQPDNTPTPPPPPPPPAS